MGKDVPGRGIKVSVAAFGKHPGWDDHIEEIGLDNDTLIQAKRVLYTEGLGGNIDSGAWDRLEEAKRLPGFKHQFYWRSHAGLIIGRMWSSSDGKGRTKYPMVVCAMVTGVPEWWAVERIPPRLAAIEEKCTQTQAAELVRLAIGEARRGLEEEVAIVAAGGLSAVGDEGSLLRKLIASEPLGGNTDRTGLYRVLYEIEREMAMFRPETSSAKAASRLIESAAQHIRVPACLTGPGEAVRAWLTLLTQEIGLGTPVLVLEPLGESFLDIIVGQSKANHLFCVRASQAGLALTSDVPYAMDESFKNKLAPKIDAWISGRTQVTSRATPQGPQDQHSKRPPWVFIIAGAVLLLALLGFLLLRGGGKSETPPPVPEPKPAANGNGNTSTVPDPPKVEPTPAPKTFAADDPRSTWGIDAELQATQQQVQTLTRELAAESKTVDPTVAQRLDRVARRIEIVRGLAANSPKDSMKREMDQADSQLAEVRRDVDAQLGESAGRVGAWIKEQESKPPVASPGMKQAWETALKAVSPREGWAAARARVATITESFKKADASLAALPQVVVPPELASNSGAIQSILDGRVADAVRVAADAAIAGDSTAAGKAGQELRAWRESATAVLAAVARVEQGMNQGPISAADAAALEQARQQSAFQPLASALGPITQRAARVQELAKESDPARLLLAIDEARQDTSKPRIAEYIAATGRLAQLPWPTAAADVQRISRIVNDDARTIFGRLSDPAKAEPLTHEAQELGRAMWLNAATNLAATPEGRSALLAAAPSVGVSDSTMGKAPAWVRYNLLRAGLEQASAAAAGQAPSQRAKALHEAAKAFMSSADGLGSAGAPAAALIDAVRPLAEKGGDLDFSKLGPGAAGWRLDSTDADRPVFVQDSPDGPQRLSFIRVETGGDDASFVSETELSVGSFIRTITEASKWNDVKPMLVQYDEAVGDPRRGPRVWTWNAKSDPPMAIATPEPGDSSNGWLRARQSMAEKQYYPEGVKVSPPASSSPMQYVSPRAAVLVSRLLGCRIPSTAEWKAAVVKAGEAAANRRDSSWKKVYEHLKPMAGSDPEWPAGGTFVPAGGKRVSPSDDGEAVATTDDGVVWFAPVDASKGLANLIGNVAEFVFDDPAALESLTDLTDAGVKAKLGKGEALRVIGGSALSGPAIDPAEPQMIRLSLSLEGFSDVGFRLAFTAPRAAAAGDVGRRLAEALAANGYLEKQQ